ncbi:MAG TPA: hypothetical protein VMF31_00995 [Solirubrobacterales bacterium]|nr:hypothetical protein [Solirubrobacterales bacterium]
MRKSPRVLFALIALIALSAFTIAACGGSDDDSGDDVTTAEYIAQADAICTEADKENDAAVKTAFGNEQPTKEEVTSFVSEEIVPTLETQLSDLRELTPPEGDADTVNGIYDRLDTAIAEVKEDPESSLNKDPFVDIYADAKAYGFRSCGVN